MNAQELFELGNRYLDGIEIEKDEKKAFECFKQAAEMGHANSMKMAGFCHQNGISLKDKQYLGTTSFLEYESDLEVEQEKAFKCFLKSVEMGDTNAMINLGFCYRSGVGVKKDEKKAFEYYQKAAEMDDVIGMLNLGYCYRNGIGVERNLGKANYWFKFERNKLLDIFKSSYDDFDIDDNLKKILDDEKYQLAWIPYDRFKDIQEIDHGGFSDVYRAIWYTQNRKLRIPVALKVIHNSNTHLLEFISELKAYCEVGYGNPSILQCYGISKQNETKQYILVLKYASFGSLSKNLARITGPFSLWTKKLNLLSCIASDLEIIHSQALIHKDLHSGNILQDDLHNGYIADLGLTSFKGSSINDKNIYGVLPYVAPEVLQGKPFSQAADIYGFGVIMSDISSGKRAFNGESLDIGLALRIIHNERPKFASNTPKCYVELAKQCMVSDPNERPNASEIVKKIENWLKLLNSDNDDEIRQQFQEADKHRPNSIGVSKLNKNYISKYINTQEIAEQLSKVVVSKPIDAIEI